MTRNTHSRTSRRTWRLYCARDGRELERQLQDRLVPCCPCCGEVVEAEPQSRLTGRLPLGARGYDLSCRPCRRFWCIVQHTERSLRLLRMRRLAAAVRAVRLEPKETAIVAGHIAA